MLRSFRFVSCLFKFSYLSTIGIVFYLLARFLFSFISISFLVFVLCSGSRPIIFFSLKPKIVDSNLVQQQPQFTHCQAKSIRTASKPNKSAPDLLQCWPNASKMAFTRTSRVSSSPSAEPTTGHESWPHAWFFSSSKWREQQLSIHDRT